MRSEENRPELSGHAGDVVQARDITGNVHFHGRQRRSEVPRQLPGDVRGYVNRDDDLGRLDRIVAEEDARVSAVCVVVGTAGVGKTSFAVHWAHRAVQHFPDGQLYVNLRGYDPGPPITPEQALERFLTALDVPAAAIPRDLESRSGLLRSRLAGKRALILLDNASSAAQVRPLLPGAPGCLVLVTSRSRLSGLVARDGARRLSLGVLTEREAVTLVGGLVAEYRPADDPAELAELVRLCARLPLALRIAAERAARRPLMPLRALIEDLRDESGLWDALTDEDDEDAVRTVFAWSYRALTADASRMFRLLGLHPGPDFGAEAAAALADTPVGRTRRLLDDLVGAHLLEQPSEDRYQFHDLLRAFAIDQARDGEDADGREAALRRVLSWYLDRASAAAAAIVPATAPGYAEAVGWYERERPNLVAATRAAASAGLTDLAWRLPTALRRVHATRNHFDDWRAGVETALPAVRAAGDRDGEALVLDSLAKLHTQAHRPDEGAEAHRAALAIRRETGDQRGQLSSLNGIGLALMRAHRLDEAKSALVEANALAIALDDDAWTANTANSLAAVHIELLETEEAEARNAEALRRYRAAGDRGGEGDALRCASQIHRVLGRFADALADADAALAIAAEHGNRAWEAWWLVEFGLAQAALGLEDAVDSCHRAAVLQRRIGDRAREAEAWDATGEAHRALGRPGEAVEFHRRAAAVFTELGDRWALAVASVNLALALTDAGEPDAAAPAREAVRALAGYTDPAARGLRQRAESLRD